MLVNLSSHCWSSWFYSRQKFFCRTVAAEKRCYRRQKGRQSREYPWRLRKNKTTDWKTSGALTCYINLLLLLSAIWSMRHSGVWWNPHLSSLFFEVVVFLSSHQQNSSVLSHVSWIPPSIHSSSPPASVITFLLHSNPSSSPFLSLEQHNLWESLCIEGRGDVSCQPIGSEEEVCLQISGSRMCSCEKFSQTIVG